MVGVCTHCGRVVVTLRVVASSFGRSERPGGLDSRRDAQQRADDVLTAGRAPGREPKRTPRPRRPLRFQASERGAVLIDARHAAQIASTFVAPEPFTVLWPRGTRFGTTRASRQPGVVPKERRTEKGTGAPRPAPADKSERAGFGGVVSTRAVHPQRHLAARTNSGGPCMVLTMATEEDESAARDALSAEVEDEEHIRLDMRRVAQLEPERNRPTSPALPASRAATARRSATQVRPARPSLGGV